MLEFVEVVSIVDCDEGDTFDIWNYDERCQDSNGGNFLIDDVVVHNSIPEAVKNRDDTRESWKNKLRNIHPILLEILNNTYGVVVWQEQLAAILQRLGGFTSPEAQEARKAVAKKWTHKLKQIGEKWLQGATQTIGREHALAIWDKLVTFGRYAFNLSHGVSYCLVAHRCFWLKAHFAPEWWASVMSDCHPDKLVRYMGVARAEGWEPTEITYCGKYNDDKTVVNGVQFDTVNIDNLTVDFTVKGDVVNQGLIGIKGIGEKAASIFSTSSLPETINFKNIDEFVQSGPGRQCKTVLERLIKLGSFKHLPGHENSKALWVWYQYKYCSGTDITAMRKDINHRLLVAQDWTEERIQLEITRQINQFKMDFPKRKKIPPKLTKFTPPLNSSRDAVIALVKEDEFSVEERLGFQKQYLGYWIDSPLELYECVGGCTINAAKSTSKNGDVVIEALVVDANTATTKNDRPYMKVLITDGIQRALVFIWEDSLKRQDFNIIQAGVGVSMVVDYDEKRSTFSVSRGETVQRLIQKSEK